MNTKTQTYQVVFLPEFNEYLAQWETENIMQLNERGMWVLEPYGKRINIELRTVEEVFEVKAEREYQYGFTGQVIEKAYPIKKTVLKSVSYKLSKTKGVLQWKEC